ncbi:MAG TPA: hypothetical protein PLI09_03795 [Candidatus Hydrogenedentes bacterium]|nr:hypothetical protein [Candidatus Hydrogenedentota bacterium]
MLASVHFIPCRVLLGAAVFISLMGWCIAEEDILTVRMKGHAEGLGATARTAAINFAQQEVLESVIQSMIASEDMSPFQPMFRNAERYLRNYDLLRCDTPDNATDVEIDAHVLERPVRQDVAALIRPRLPKPPKVLLIAGEQIGDAQAATIPSPGIVETTLVQELKKLKFDVSTSESVTALYPKAQLIELLRADMEICGKFARGTLADVVMLGVATTVSEGATGGGNVARTKATLTLRVFRGLDGKMTDDLTRAAAVYAANPGESGEQAVQDACIKMAGDIVVAGILAAVSALPPDTILLVLEHPNARDKVDGVVQVLKSTPGVSAVEELYYSDALARLRVTYSGPVSTLVNLLTTENHLRARTVIGREMTMQFVE